jgi:phospholipase/lecithinase/hemolysin
LREAAAKTVTVPLSWDVLLEPDGVAAGAEVPQAASALVNPTATVMATMLFFRRRVLI